MPYTRAKCATLAEDEDIRVHWYVTHTLQKTPCFDPGDDLANARFSLTTTSHLLETCYTLLYVRVLARICSSMGGGFLKISI